MWLHIILFYTDVGVPWSRAAKKYDGRSTKDNEIFFYFTCICDIWRIM